MRIIGGQAKRRSIQSISPVHGVRPILARIRKSVFDILKPRLDGSVFLDLYAGTGIVGIEALSRGAATAYFVDQNAFCVRIVQKNLRDLGLIGKGHAFRADATKPMKYFTPYMFDLIFMGPPYHDDKYNRFHLTQPTLQNIEACRLLKPTGIVIGQHHEKENPVDLPNWELFRQEKYGDTRVSFFKLKETHNT